MATRSCIACTSLRNCTRSARVEAGPWARDDRVEVELQRTVERARPVVEAAALRVIHVDAAPRRLARGRGGRLRRAAEKQVARVNGLDLREVDDRVAVRVPAAEVPRPHF